MIYNSFAFYITMLRKSFVSYCNEKISNFGITYRQLFVLIYINKKQECSSKDIVEYLKIDAGQLNRILTKLLEKNLITQRKSDDDRRFNILGLTKSGIKVVEESQKLFYSWDAQVLSELDDNSRQELMNFMKKLTPKYNTKMEENTMNKLREFMNLLTGSFNNSEQFEKMKQSNLEFPYAEHINTICNGKITNLPENFQGIFMVEESYYTSNGNTHASPHLFLFTEEENGIQLTSYEVPEGYDKNTFTYKELKQVDYNTLKVSEKFTPALYIEKDGVWEGGSTSMFSPVLKFTLFERFSKESLEVHETMEVNGRRTFGYDDPILYKRVIEDISE